MRNASCLVIISCLSDSDHVEHNNLIRVSYIPVMHLLSLGGKHEGHYNINN